MSVGRRSTTATTGFGTIWLIANRKMGNKGLCMQVCVYCGYDDNDCNCDEMGAALIDVIRDQVEQTRRLTDSIDRLADILDKAIQAAE